MEIAARSDMDPILRFRRIDNRLTDLGRTEVAGSHVLHELMAVRTADLNLSFASNAPTAA
jgi:hypothetical protein